MNQRKCEFLSSVARSSVRALLPRTHSLTPHPLTPSLAHSLTRSPTHSLALTHFHALNRHVQLTDCIFAACGLVTTFTLTALSRSHVEPHTHKLTPERENVRVRACACDRLSTVSRCWSWDKAKKQNTTKSCALFSRNEAWPAPTTMMQSAQLP